VSWQLTNFDNAPNYIDLFGTEITQTLPSVFLGMLSFMKRTAISLSSLHIGESPQQSKFLEYKTIPNKARICFVDVPFPP
jgi:hypothetical protein